MGYPIHTDSMAVGTSIYLTWVTGAIVISIGLMPLFKPDYAKIRISGFIDMFRRYWAHMIVVFSVYLWKESPTYDFVSVFIKNNSINQYLTNKDEKYTILSVRGYNRFIEDYDNCLVKRDEIVEIFSGIFPYSTKQAEIRPKSDDPSGNSIFNAVYWFLEGEGLANLSCSNYEEKFRISNNKTEGLSVIIRSEEVNNWLNNKK